MAIQQVSAYCLLWDDVALKFVGFRNLSGQITMLSGLDGIEDLPDGGSVTGTEVLPVVRDGETVQLTSLALALTWLLDPDAVQRARAVILEGLGDIPLDVNDPGLLALLDLKANKVNPVLSGATLAQSPPANAAGNEVTTAAFVRAKISEAIALANSPVNTVLPAVSVSGGGPIDVGTVLNGTSGTWTGQATITYAYQWFRNGTAISGETSIDHTVVADDQGTLLTLRVRASNGIASNVEAFSAGTQIPAAAVLTLVTQPTMSGTPAVGQTLTVGNGVYSITPTSYARQWYRGNTLIPGATGSTYVVVTADQGLRLLAKITASVGTQSLTVDSAYADIPAAAPPPPPPAPPPSSISASHIIAMIDPTNTTFSGITSDWGLETDGQVVSVNGLSDANGYRRSDIGSPYGTLRFGKIDNPTDGTKKCLIARCNVNDAETSLAPRAEFSVWHTMSNGQPRPGAIKTNQVTWFGFGLNPMSFPNLDDYMVLFQLHQLGGVPANPFFSIEMQGTGIRAHLRWNATPSSASNQSTSSAVRDFPRNAWTYFVGKFKHGTDASQNPFFTLWQDGVQVLNRTGIIGYNSPGNPPWQKLGLYPWGYKTSNVWDPSYPTKAILYRTPIFVVDTNNVYTEAIIRARVEAS